MRKFALLVLIFQSLTATARSQLRGLPSTLTLVSGGVQNPGAVPFNGSLIISLTKAGLSTTCTGLNTPIPSRTTFTVSNGSFSGSLISTDCLSSFVPYKAVLINTKGTVISTTYWYVTQAAPGTPVLYTGGLLNNNGNRSLYDTGLSFTNTGNKNVFTFSRSYPAGFKIASGALSSSVGAGATVTAPIVNWPTPFNDVAYTAVCVVPGGTPLQVSSFVSVTRYSVTVNITNVAASGSFQGSVTCRGVEP